MAKVKRKKSIFQVIVIPISLVFILFAVITTCMLYFGGIFSELNNNAKDMLSQQNENRRSFLVNDVINNYSDIHEFADSINSVVEDEITNNGFVLSDLNYSEKSLKVMNEVSDILVDLIYDKDVNGAYVVFNTHDLSEKNFPEELNGLFYRDLDPDTITRYYRDDLLAVRGPENLIKAEDIAFDDGWEDNFVHADSIYQDFFRVPFSEAYNDDIKTDMSVYGYWTTATYSLTTDNYEGISYSLPLILDGQVYGVLGVELFSSYIETLLPYSNLIEDNKGAFLVAVNKEGSDRLTPVVLSAENNEKADIAHLDFIIENDDELKAYDVNKEYYIDIKELVVYPQNTAYTKDSWYLLSFAYKSDIFSFTNEVQETLFKASIISFIIGMIALVLVSFRYSNPIIKLSNVVAMAENENEMPTLPSTGIKEIDRFADSITKLGTEVIESSTRLLSIMEMASVEIAGYEYNDDSEEIFITDNLLNMLGIRGIDITKLTKTEFLKKLEWVKQSLQYSISDKGDYIFSVPLGGGGINYRRYEEKQIGNKHIGLLEDVTSSVVEKIRVEHERDCDGLTGLYNGQGFRRRAKSILEEGNSAKCAAFLMMDLDNLKGINDNFGHLYGDRYIKYAAQCFEEIVDDENLCGRISGDEFCILYHGYNNKDEILENIEYLYESMKQFVLKTPNGEEKRLSISGGIVFYPDHGQDMITLMKYADFAMYTAKKTHSGTYCVFDYEAYKERERKNQLHTDFKQLLEKRRVNYHFQPIFSSWDGSVYAYEALMRVSIPSLRSPLTVIEVAREENKLNEIEEITMFCSTECFKKLRENGKIYPGAKMFVNSIANASMSEKSELRYNQIYSAMQEDIVVEITESEQLNYELLEQKKRSKGFTGKFALDDYGSGYNNEINLLKMNPHYIKLDISIVRDIDKSEDQRQIVRNIISYAHERHMLIVAEGVETAEEMRTCLELGADLLQGYFLGRPMEVPEEMYPEARKVLDEFISKRNI